jgi:REP element-mobilizing transposase RayT
MATRTFTFAQGEFYHLYNRGVEKRIIYQDTADYSRFLELLYVANTKKETDLRSISRHHESLYDWDRGENLVKIGAYCLMPNHFHILLTPIQENGVSRFMSKLGTSYSMYFNKKYERTGGLFESEFKAKHANSDQYLKYLFAYIHLNPVKLIQSDWKERGIADVEAAYKYVSSFPYSSLVDYQEIIRPERVIIESSAFPNYFKSTSSRKAELFEWLNFKEPISGKI